MATRKTPAKKAAPKNDFPVDLTHKDGRKRTVHTLDGLVSAEFDGFALPKGKGRPAAAAADANQTAGTAGGSTDTPAPGPDGTPAAS